MSSRFGETDGWGAFEESPVIASNPVDVAPPVAAVAAAPPIARIESDGWGEPEPVKPAAEKAPAPVATTPTSNGGWGEPEPVKPVIEAKPTANNNGGWGDESTANTNNDGWGDDDSTSNSTSSHNSSRRNDEPPSDPVRDEAMVNGLMESLQNVSVKLADKQSDVNSPLYSIKSFEELGLSPNLLKGIYSMKFVRPSKVQEKALPLLLSDPPQNMIAQSQSGTGKTAAFSLTMLHRIDTTIDCTQAVCVAPTRELARQIIDVVKTMGAFTDITISSCLRDDDQQSAAAPAGEDTPEWASAAFSGGGGMSPRLSRQSSNAHILVGTPGTILSMELKGLINLENVKVFVLDEADVMLDKEGMGMQSMRLRKSCAEECQMLLFSATFSEAVFEFAHAIIPDANEIALKRDEVSVDAIKQYWVECHGYQNKIEMLGLIYGLLTVSQSIVFLATRAAAEEVRDRMVAEGHLVSVIHGAMSPSERDNVIDEFRQGRTKVLLATNVLARGIDIMQVSLVINFDLPMTMDRLPDPETYVHRIGRTGRFGRSGVAINFVGSRESRECLEALQEFFGREIVRMPTESIELLERKLASINKGSSSTSN